MSGGGSRLDAPPISFRRPTETDHAFLDRVVNDWFGGRRVRHLLARVWFRHFAATSWLAESDHGAPVGFLVGFVSPGRPDEAVVHLVGVDPNLRRRGIGRELETRFLADAQANGARRIVTFMPPGDPIALRFHLAVGFRVVDDPGSSPVYGTPAVVDYDGADEDRVILVRDVTVESPGSTAGR